MSIADEIAREAAKEAREKALAEGRAEGRSEGRSEGRTKGRAEGRAELLIRLLTTRFGALSDATVERIHGAPMSDLDNWAERLFSAGSLDEVLGRA